MRAVGGDEVTRADRALVAAVPRADRRGHAVGVLLDLDRLRGVLDGGADLRRFREQDRLEADLRDEEPPARADVLDALVDRPEVPVELLAAEALDGDDRSVLDELAAGRVLDLALEPDRAVGLHRALADQRRARMDGGSPMALDDEGRHPARAEEDGRRQPDKAAADDQDGDVVSAVVTVSTPARVRRLRAPRPVTPAQPEPLPAGAASCALPHAEQEQEARARPRSSRRRRASRSPRRPSRSTPASTSPKVAAATRTSRSPRLGTRASAGAREQDDVQDDEQEHQDPDRVARARRCSSRSSRRRPLRARSRRPARTRPARVTGRPSPASGEAGRALLDGPGSVLPRPHDERSDRDQHRAEAEPGARLEVAELVERGGRGQEQEETEGSRSGGGAEQVAADLGRQPARESSAARAGRRAAVPSSTYLVAKANGSPIASSPVTMPAIVIARPSKPMDTSPPLGRRCRACVRYHRRRACSMTTHANRSGWLIGNDRRCGDG